MGKWLSGSAKTGEKIIENHKRFFVEFSKKDGDMYTFLWSFDNQHGFINITVKDEKMSNSSLINTDSDSIRRFKRALGVYNDSTLIPVFINLMKSINVKIDGVYSN
ncbi:MAG: hypothetical protein H6Q70_3728 [Firmicutes bacterium]|nr:hypothetical protein [Bacillota bacterium]